MIGDIVTGKLVVEVGATFTGSCNMGPVIKDIKDGDQPTLSKENPLSDNRALMRYATMGTQMLDHGRHDVRRLLARQTLRAAIPHLHGCTQSLLGIAAAFYLSLKDLLKEQ